jgi:LCP family protein required for cell wall assembly
MNEREPVDSSAPRASSRRGSSTTGLLILALAAIVATTAVAVRPLPEAPAAPGAASADQSTGGVLDLATTTYTTAAARRILGTDGRFTILLLGSDSRPSHPGLRTDAILIASVDPVTGKAAIASIPRDMVNFPISATRRYGGKINAIYQYLARSTKTPGTQLRKIIGRALGIEIDAYALLGFAGFRKLVNNVGGLDVYVAKAFYDRTYSIRRGHYGFGLSRGWHHLVDLRALAFARTRHADSDYARARRQQQLVAAAVKKVAARGLTGLATLLIASRGLIKTDLPLAYAPLAFAMVARANIAGAHKVVFGPTTYATHLSGTNNVLRMTVVKAWIRRYFPPIHKYGAWLPPTPTPNPTPTPTTSPTPTPTATPTPTPTPTPAPTPTPTPV